jgi:hypothetical protein
VTCYAYLIVELGDVNSISRCVSMTVICVIANRFNDENNFAFVNLESYASAVGTPVTGRPPHFPGRAVCPHPVPRLCSLSRGPSQLPVTRPSCYSPQ